MQARLSILVVALTACGGGRYAWRPAEGPMDERRLQADVAACEQYRVEVESKGPKASSGGARPYGGWGDSNFDWCMDRRGWVLKRVPAGAEPVTAAGVAPAGPQPAPAGAAAAGIPPDACPVTVPGTRLAVGDTEDGEAITFTAYPERLGEVRDRTRALADLYNRYVQGSGAGGAPGGEVPPSRATAEDVPGGARLAVTPERPADLPRIRTLLRSHADRMRDTGRCEGQAGAR